MSNYPPGAENDVRAPYNEEFISKSKVVSYNVCLCIDFNVTKSVLINESDEAIIDDIKEELRSIKDTEYSHLNINVNELIITKD